MSATGRQGSTRCCEVTELIQPDFIGEPEVHTSVLQNIDLAAECALPPGDMTLRAHVAAAQTTRAVTAVTVDAPGAVTEVAIEDWQDTLNAIKSRLRLAVGEPLSRQFNGAAVHVQASVMECIVAIDRLHATLAGALAQPCGSESVGTALAEIQARRDQLHARMASMATRSTLRKRLDQLLAAAATDRPRFALLYVELDGLRPILDARGRVAGVELPQVIGARLRQAVHGVDLVSHLGADEFACVLKDGLDHDQLKTVAGKILDSVSAPLKIGKLVLEIRPSIGIAMCPTDGSTAAVLIESAEFAMVRAKRHQTGYAFSGQPGASWG